MGLGPHPPSTGLQVAIGAADGWSWPGSIPLQRRTGCRRVAIPSPAHAPHAPPVPIVLLFSYLRPVSVRCSRHRSRVADAADAAFPAAISAIILDDLPPPTPSARSPRPLPGRRLFLARRGGRGAAGGGGAAERGGDARRRRLSHIREREQSAPAPRSRRRSPAATPVPTRLLCASKGSSLPPEAAIRGPLPPAPESRGNTPSPPSASALTKRQMLTHSPPPTRPPKPGIEAAIPSLPQSSIPLRPPWVDLSMANSSTTTRKLESRRL